MTIEEFKNTLTLPEPPGDLNVLLKALWFDANGDWKASHELAQEVETSDGSWVHGYLHRKEGDDSNAGYWYRKSGRKFPRMTLDQEWEEIVRQIL